MNADPHGELNLVIYGRRVFFLGNRIEDRETGTDRALGVIVMRLRIAEERHHPIAEILSDLAAELGDRFARGSMIRGQYFMPLLRIETSSDFSRVHQVRERGLLDAAAHRPRFSDCWHLAQLGRFPLLAASRIRCRTSPLANSLNRRTDIDA